MAGRPRLYQNAAEKTRAYRARQHKQQVQINRLDWEQIQGHLERLIQAVLAAKSAGDPLATSLKTVSRLDLLSDLAAHFEACCRQQKSPKQVK